MKLETDSRLNRLNSRARLPAVDRLLSADASQTLIQEFGRSAVTNGIRSTLARLRNELQGNPDHPMPNADTLMQLVSEDLQQSQINRLRPVINLTGTVLHTNLGRALLPVAAIEQLTQILGSASNLEFDLKSGKRGDRDASVEALICQITGAEAATVVNNNAAAVLLVLQTLGRDREIPVSRGELVEIGGSFRIPEIMASSGCRLVEVGATNRTHLADFSRAINSNTALLMKVHTSNYEIKGFTKAVPEAELAALAHQHQLPFVNDLGSGTLIDLSRYGLPFEPTAQAALTQGADLVTFSGDKLLGGPQAGIIVGRRDLIEQLKSNPLKRALRVDKMTMVTLFEVLKLYLHPDTLATNLPTLRYLTRPADSLRALASELQAELAPALKGIARVNVIECLSQIGSGSLPLERLPSYGLTLTTDSGTDQALTGLAAAFRALPVPVIGRIHDRQLIFDLRTLDHPDALLKQLPTLVASVQSNRSANP
jgi:L-seryl-tRNA(Ser) seleniumtransferase